MVLLEKVGKQRSFGLGLLLTFLTLGIYGLYWTYKVHKEVYDQFELKKEGRDDGLLFFVVGIFASVIRWIFTYKAIDNLNLVRSRSNMPVKLTPGKFLAWEIGSSAVATFVLFFTLLSMTVSAGPGPITDDEAGRILARFVTGIVLYVVISFGGGAVGYAMYQRSLNEVWDRYDGWRADQIERSRLPAAEPPLF